MANPITSVTGIAATSSSLSGTSTAVTATVTLQTGDILLAFLGAGGSQNLNSVTDNSGVTSGWTIDYSSGSLAGARRFHVARTRVTSNLTSTSVTFTTTLSANSVNRGLEIILVRGASALSPQIYSTYDQVVSSTPTSTGATGTFNGTDYSYTSTTGSITPTYGDEIVFALQSTSLNITGTLGAASASNGYTMLSNTPFVNYMMSAYLLQGDTPSSTNTTFTWTSGATPNVLEYGLISYSVITTVSDTGSGVESTPSASLSVPVSDASLSPGLDVASSSMAIPVSDTGSSADSAILSSAVPASDTGSGVESAPTTSSSLAASDTGSGAESSAIAATLSAADTGSGTDAVALDVAQSVSDSGSGVDAVTGRGVYDAGSGTDTASVVFVLTPSVNDSIQGTESVTVLTTISVSDGGRGVDTQDAHIPQPYFEPPVVIDRPNYLPDSQGLAVRLWRHYKLRPRGVNVFLLSDGTYVQDTATAENGDTGYPLPWILNDPKNEISYVTNFDGTVTHTYLNPHIVKIYEGGHLTPLTQDEAASLVAAGYTVEYI